jgi:hypothetical protein
MGPCISKPELSAGLETKIAEELEALKFQNNKMSGASKRVHSAVRYQKNKVPPLLQGSCPCPRILLVTCLNEISHMWPNMFKIIV